jgi:hypothetical protein
VASNSARRVSVSASSKVEDRRRSDSNRSESLPALSQRRSGVASAPTEARNDSNEGERSFSDQLPAFEWSISSSPRKNDKSGTGNDSNANLQGSKSSFGDSLKGIQFDAPTAPDYVGAVKEDPSTEEPLGAAASLRARLLKIREKNNQTSNESNKAPISVETAEKTLDSLLSDNEEPDLTAETPRNDPAETPLEVVREILDKSFASFHTLSEKQTPLLENDPDIMECTESLKTIHAAISQQPQLAVNLDARAVKELRKLISQRVNEIVGCLTR